MGLFSSKKALTALWAVFVSVTFLQSQADAALSTLPPAAYSSWLTEHGNEYDDSLFFGNNDEVVVHWKIDGDTLKLATAVEADGWLGFGISAAGGMPGSDIVVYTAKTNDLVDSYALVDGMPLPDDNCQDWTLHRATVEPGFILFEASRLLSTGDTQDHEIVNDAEVSMPSHRIIAAWGDSDEMSYHFENRTGGFIRFFSNATSQEEVDPVDTQDEKTEEVGQLYLKAGNFLIPENETTYQDFCFSTSDMMENGLPSNSTVQITAIDYVKDPDTIPFIHHLILYAADGEAPTCEEAFKMIYLWAPGSEPLRLPQDVGFSLGGKDGINMLRMEIHYDNRDGLTDKIDDSGVVVNYTTTPRTYEASVFTLGDAIGALNGEEVGEGFTQYDFLCPGSCTTNHFPGSVTVFLELLHMHETGARMVQFQSRNGAVIHEGNVDYYDFKAAGGFAVIQEPYEIEPGDSLQTTCYYKEDDGPRKFGLGSRDEMCLTFLLYYPKIKTFYDFCGFQVSQVTNDESCDASMNMRTLSGEEEVGRTFGVAGTECAMKKPVETAAETQASRAYGTSDGKKRNTAWSLYVVVTVAVLWLC